MPPAEPTAETKHVGNTYNSYYSITGLGITHGAKGANDNTLTNHLTREESQRKSAHREFGPVQRGLDRIQASRWRRLSLVQTKVSGHDASRLRIDDAIVFAPIRKGVENEESRLLRRLG